MKLISFEIDNHIKVGVVENDMIYDLNKMNNNIANSVVEFIKGGQTQIALAESVINTTSPTIPIKGTRAKVIRKSKKQGSIILLTN